ncbi:MAG: hypothetical protein RSA86_02760, partial [Christensenellaceae bacterium]
TSKEGGKVTRCMDSFGGFVDRQGRDEMREVRESASRALRGLKADRTEMKMSEEKQAEGEE